MSSSLNLPPALPASTQQVLRDFMAHAGEVFKDHLIAAVLFGSAAEGRLRPQSDVNLILVVREFTPVQAEVLSASLNLARAAIQLQVMFLAASEIPVALECFAQKFADILRRHHTIWGSDPFAGLSVSREEEIRKTQQVLLNLTLRLRERYALLASQPDRLTQAIADSIGPLRTCAAAILEIEGKPANSPKEAFAAIIQELNVAAWSYLPQHFSAVREQVAGGPPAGAVIGHLLALATAMRLRLESHL